jgi:hypothetical protein
METVCFRFSRFHIPQIESLEGKHPRLYFDLHPVVEYDGRAKKSVNGSLIYSIRTFLHREEKRLRVVVDLNSDYNYRVEQRCSAMKKTMCLVIQAEE